MVEIGALTFKSGQATLNYLWHTRCQDIYHRIYPLNNRFDPSDACLKSPLFSTPHSNNAKQWRIIFYPKNPKKEFNNFSSIFLQYFGINEVTVALEFSSRHNNDPPFVKKTLGKQVFGPQSACYGFHEYLDLSMAHYYKPIPLTEDSVFFSCRLFFDFPLAIPEIMHHPIDKKSRSPEHSSQDDCQGDFHQLFETELLADVTVNIGQQKKSLHKAILASRSDVFRAMFQHDMVEKAQNVVNVVDIRPEVAMEMFRYMYSGKINNLDKLPVDELLIAAEKYAITGLKAICDKTLDLDLNFDNALQYLTLASVHNSPYLKKKVMEFIVKYLDKFVDNPQFKSLDQSVVCELLSAVAKNKY